MVYVVERYLPDLSRSQLLSGLSRLTPAIEELRAEGSAVRYLGSTIVLGDDACFCQFEGFSEAVVAEANRRAALPFDRIVPAVTVKSNQRSNEMSVSTSLPRAARHGRALVLVLIVALAAVIVVAVLAMSSSSGGRPARQSAATNASVLRSLTPQQRQWVTGIASLSDAQLAAAFGADRQTQIAAARASLSPKPQH